tara:strand:+ start:1916 stop:2818 length:903 start_codon:yes stop_codon:yes gene_type:complete
MKIKIQLLLISFLLVFSCKSEPKNEVDTVVNENSLIKVKNNENLNISILLDLSDRIDTLKYPNNAMQYYKRDVGYLKSIASAFSYKTSYKKSRKLNDKIQMYFDPEPSNPQINSLSNSLKVHINRDNGTKDFIDNVPDFYEKNSLKIYELALKDNNFIGSDIWGFFKNKVEDFCIEKESRNILILLTDGYIYHKDSKRNEENLSSYVTPQTIRANDLINSNWKTKIEEGNFGFIPINTDLSNLEVLVLGINPSKKNQYDDEVIKKYWSDWFSKMNVKKFELKNSNLPSNMDKIINDFIVK